MPEEEAVIEDDVHGPLEQFRSRAPNELPASEYAAGMFLMTNRGDLIATERRDQPPIQREQRGIEIRTQARGVGRLAGAWEAGDQMQRRHSLDLGLSAAGC